MVESRRKTGFVGFLVNIDSILNVSEWLTFQPTDWKIFLTYKFSQNHIELFWGKYQILWGIYNNPTTRQLFSSYRKLHIHNDVQQVWNGNCIPEALLEILTSSNDTGNVSKIGPSKSTPMKIQWGNRMGVQLCGKIRGEGWNAVRWCDGLRVHVLHVMGQV